MFKFLKKFSNKQLDVFAESLAEDVAKKYPPSMADDPSVKVSEKRLTKILQNVFDRAGEFHSEHKLGVYRKARLGNTFRWKLKELGYGKQFIDVATEGLIVNLSKK